MTLSTFNVTTDPTVSLKTKKYPWYFAPIFCVIWFTLFYVAVIPSFYSYPETLLIRDERNHPDEFIGERAQLQLLALNNIGVKLTGSVENDVLAVNFLLYEIEKIRSSARLDLYDIDVEVQLSSGSFYLWDMATSYKNVSNVIVKISPKYSKSESYLLVNSHFDSEVGSPGAADAGVMIVIMLETLRVISISEKELKNPIVFLMNGAEEANLLAAHGFITDHKWASYCKAVINLDSAGSGGREILFQSGPFMPWIMKYYKKSAKHPYANTIGEELFQGEFIPSDTDYRIFRDHGGLRGLDMAHTLNGYIYHTKYDNFINLERGTYQTTGDNVLALTWAIANAPELELERKYNDDGYTVFYDYLGWFLIFYTESTGIAINIVTSVCALLVIIFSIYKMTTSDNGDSLKQVVVRILSICFVQVITDAVAFGAVLLIAVIIDALSLTQSWYSEEWLIFGLYFCPLFFVLTMGPALYITWTKNKTNMSLDDTISCFMHTHCIVLVVICLTMTGLRVRSAYFPMIAIFFYTIAVILNLLFRQFGKSKLFMPIHMICQLLPFWFYTYLTFAFLKTFIPMQGRDGPTSKPEIFMAGFSAIMALLFAGFILPMLHKFRKTKMLISTFAALFVIFLIIAATPAGFPYKKNVAPQRFYVLHTDRVVRDFWGTVVKNESGFYIQPVDTRPYTLDDSVFSKAMPQSWTDEECKTELNCGLPLYSSRWLNWKNSARWIPAERPYLPIETDLKVSNRREHADSVTFEFTLKAADRVVIYIDPCESCQITDWSFNLQQLFADVPKFPYFIYHLYSFDDAPLEFFIKVQYYSETRHEEPTLRIGVGAHFLYHTDVYTEEYRKFLNDFPDWAYPTNWVASYQSWDF